MSVKTKTTGPWIDCEHCGGKHAVTYSHEGRWGQGSVYAAVCEPSPGVTDYYTAQAVHGLKTKVARIVAGLYEVTEGGHEKPAYAITNRDHLGMRTAWQVIALNHNGTYRTHSTSTYATLADAKASVGA